MISGEEPFAPDFAEPSLPSRRLDPTRIQRIPTPNHNPRANQPHTRFQANYLIWRTLLAALGGLLALAPSGGYAQKIDLNGNGMSDVWEALYDASALSPTADTDGDGVPNLLESLAGTNPLDSNSVPRIAFAAVTGTNFVAALPGTLGKQYALQGLEPSTPAEWTNWIAECAITNRTAGTVSLQVPATAVSKFFRIAISDVDTDGDGLNDWEEYQLGLDPFTAASNGQLDGNGQPLGDFAYVAGKLAAQNEVTIAALDVITSQPDSGGTATDPGLFSISRNGFPLRALTVNIAPSPAGPGVATEGIDFAPVPRSLYFPVGSASQTVSLTPLANPGRAAPVIATLDLLSGPGYRLGTPTNASVVIYPSATPSGTGLTGQYFTNASPTYSSTANFNPVNLKLTRLDPTIDFTWGTTTTPIPNNGYYTVRWTGQVQPQYSELYYFVANTDDGVKLWVNDQLVINNWVSRSAADSTGAIALQAGIRYNLKMEYFQGAGSAVAHLSWYSDSQPKQIIPAERLYPTSVPPGPAAITSPLNAYAFLGQPFSFTVTGANSPTSYSAQGLPPGLTFNTATRLINGTPTLSGTYQVLLTAGNAAGMGASLLNIQVLATGSSVVREVWSAVPGTAISDIPLDQPATSTNILGALEGVTNFGANYAERIRGYITAPVTGNYFFWLAASDSAELWISNDNEPANKVRRAYVTPGGTGPRQWAVQPNQKSPWLALVAGQRYYLEILHKAGTATNDNWSIGWLQDLTGTNNTPSAVVPGYVLSRYYPLPVSYVPGTLYTADMLPQTGISSPGVGSATLRVSADGLKAILKFSHTPLSSPVTGEHIHADPYLSHPSQIMFDIDATTPEPDGSYVWNIAPVGTLSPADILEIIREGKAYINVHTVINPAGEINGHFTLAEGTQTFTPPPAAPAWTDDHASSNAAARFLIQATFGPSRTEIASVQALGYAGWINHQFTIPPTYHLPYVLENRSADPVTPYPSSLVYKTWWRQSITAPDQLRQRLAFALGEIMVVSQKGILQNRATALSSYYDTLLDHAFTNFRDLLQAVTLSPAMGLYLDMRGNDKGSLVTGLHPNENYAREILQLFSIGLYRMWPDGTLVLDSQDSLVPTYDQSVIMGFARVFTGWNYYQANQANGRLPTNFSPPANYINPMVLVPTHHELGTKLLLDNVMLPQAWGSQATSSSTNFDIYCSQDLQRAMDSIFFNENVGPFLCRQLIQRLVTSNPSRDYLYRVVQKFNDNGSGVRGDLKAVIAAILLDYDARSPVLMNQSTFGKQREPLLRATATARAFPPPADFGGSYAQNGTQIISLATTNAHRLNNGDTVLLSFTDTSGQPAPPTQGYSVTVTGPSSFTVNAPGLLKGTYLQSPNTTISNMVTSTVLTTNVIFLNSFSGHGLAPGWPVYLQFTSGGAPNGIYQVISTTNTTSFAVIAREAVARSGSALLPKFTGGGYLQRQTNVTFTTTMMHGLKPGDPVFVNFTVANSPADGQYVVNTVPDATHFTIVVAKSANVTQRNQVIYPLVTPVLVRSGTVGVAQGTWNIGATDTGSTYNLAQTPLNSPTVFNFFSPDYKFPGALAAAGLTTPEFELTSDTTVALQMNFLTSGILTSGNNTNGLTSFVNHNGAVVLDLGPWMTMAYTANSAALTLLVDNLNTLLTGGQLSTSARSLIVNYVASTANFPYSSPPTSAQIRNRVQAVVHLLITSPDFTIQK